MRLLLLLPVLLPCRAIGLLPVPTSAQRALHLLNEYCCIQHLFTQHLTAVQKQPCWCRLPLLNAAFGYGPSSGDSPAQDAQQKAVAAAATPSPRLLLFHQHHLLLLLLLLQLLLPQYLGKHSYCVISGTASSAALSSFPHGTLLRH
jgi:hypothetical protein